MTYPIFLTALLLIVCAFFVGVALGLNMEPITAEAAVAVPTQQSVVQTWAELGWRYNPPPQVQYTYAQHPWR